LQNDLKQRDGVVKEHISSELAEVQQSYGQQIKQLEEKLRTSLQD